MKKPKVRTALDAIADTVLAYRPVARSKPAVQRKRRKTILEKKRAKGDKHYAQFAGVLKGTKKPA